MSCNIDETIRGLRSLTNWLEEKQDALSGAGVYVASIDLNLVPGNRTREAFEAAASLLPNPRYKTDIGSYLNVEHAFTRTVKASVLASKHDVCTRRQVSTQHVEAVPSHDEPVYEWDCEPINILGERDTEPRSDP